MVVSFLASKCLLQCDQLDESRGVTSTILKQMKERVSASVSDFTRNFRRLRPKTFVVTIGTPAVCQSTGCGKGKNDSFTVV